MKLNLIRVHGAVLAMAAVLLAPALGNAAEDMPATGVSGVFTPEMRDGFLAAAEKSLHDRASVRPEFWSWLDAHKTVRTGLLSVADPVPASAAENLDELRKDLGPDIAERYASLLLGASLGPRFGSTHATGGDGAYNASAYGTATSSSPEAAKVAGYLKEKNISLVDFVARKKEILGELGLAENVGKKELGAFIDQVAYALGTYPPHEPLPVAVELRKVISRFETKLPVFADKGPEWPLFPLDQAPWPLLAPMRQTVSDRELDYLWDRFTGKTATGPKRMVTYSRYTFDYEKPEIRYKSSAWYPTALPRIIEDGGVCGRQSTLAQLTQVALGRPAVGMYQPGHRALLSYRFEAKTGHYVALREQSITTPDKSTLQWYLPSALGPRVREDGRVVGLEYHVALALAMNTGLERYTDSRIAFWLAQRATDRSDKEALLARAADLNPYDLDPWFALATLAGKDPDAVNRLVRRLDQLLLSPDVGLAEVKELAGDTDLSQHAAREQAPDLKKDSNLVAALVGDAILQEAYGAALVSGAERPAHRAGLRRILSERSAAGITPGPELEGLMLRFDMAVDGPATLERTVAQEVRDAAAADSGKKRQHKRDLAEVKAHVAAVLEALPQAQQRVTWLAPLCTGYPATERFQLAEGKAKPQLLYGYLYEELLKSLNATGAAGKAQSKRLGAELEAARAEFESKGGKS